MQVQSELSLLSIRRHVFMEARSHVYSGRKSENDCMETQYHQEADQDQEMGWEDDEDEDDDDDDDIT